MEKVLDAAARFDTRPSEGAMRELVQRRSMTPLFL
jgi:hypothetical protein